MKWEPKFYPTHAQSPIDCHICKHLNLSYMVRNNIITSNSCSCGKAYFFLSFFLSCLVSVFACVWLIFRRNVRFGSRLYNFFLIVISLSKLIEKWPDDSNVHTINTMIQSEFIFSPLLFDTNHASSDFRKNKLAAFVLCTYWICQNVYRYPWYEVIKYLWMSWSTHIFCDWLCCFVTATNCQFVANIETCVWSCVDNTTRHFSVDNFHTETPH